MCGSHGRYVAALTPHLVVSSLAGGDGVDDTTDSYLFKAALKLKKKEEEERRKEAEQKGGGAREVAPWSRRQSQSRPAAD